MLPLGPDGARSKQKQALKTWIRGFPDHYYLANFEWANAIRYDDALSEKDVMYVFETDLKAAAASPDPQSYIGAAELSDFVS